MSLYGALITGVAGLDANANALSVASSNIANVNTVGYKTDQSQFSTLVATSGGSGDSSTASVIADVRQNFAQQGLLTSTSSPTDLGINGNGMFSVSQAPLANGTPTQMMYTRAGNFTPDGTGNLKNAAGYYLLGWQLDANGNPPTNPLSLSTINVNNMAGKAQPTTSVSMQANLQASDTIDAGYTPGDMTSGVATPQFQRTIDVFDSQGGAQPLELSFIKTAPNTWSYEVTYQGAAGNITGTNPIASGTMAFNTDGSLANANTAGPPTNTVNVSIPWSPASGLAAQTIGVSMGTIGNTDGVTQFDTPSALTNTTVNGAVFGNVSGLSIDKNGIVSADFSNGLTQKVFQIPLATFVNPDGLSEVNGNAYTATINSGTPILTMANVGAGSIQSSTLEASTVDLANEFTNLITTQRAYSASSRIVTTASSMLDELLQMAR
jgi:flagellar hook protein FlgE